MWNCNTVILLCLFVIGAVCLVDEMIAKGKWTINNIMKCPDDDQYSINVDLKRRKYNRTHDGFSIKAIIPDIITVESHGVYVDICRKVDGGCKTQQIIDEKSMCNFFNKYGKESFERGLSMAGVDPPNCPIPAGDFIITEYVVDYEEFPEDGMLGDFLASIYLTKNGKKYSCIIFDVTFSKVG